jgi:hypothetical protein
MGPQPFIARFTDINLFDPSHNKKPVEEYNRQHQNSMIFYC